MRRKWQYQSPKAACAFEPSRFEARAQVVDNSVDKLPEEIDFG